MDYENLCTELDNDGDLLSYNMFCTSMTKN